MLVNPKIPLLADGLGGFEQHVVYASGQGSPPIGMSVRASRNSKRGPPRWGGTSGAAINQPNQKLKRFLFCSKSAYFSASIRQSH